MENYDKLLAISFSLLCSAILFIKIFNLNISLALFNVVITMLPIGYLLLKLKLVFEKKELVLTLLLVIIMFVNLTLNITSMGNENIQEEVAFILMTILNLLVIYGIFSTNLNCKQDFEFKYIYISVIIMATILCIYNLIINYNEIGSIFSSNYKNSFSFSSVFDNRNNFALFLFVTLVVTNLHKQKQKIKTNWITIAQILFFINLLLTFSRTGVIVILLFIFIYLLLTKKKKKYIVLGCIVVIAIIIINPVNILEVFNDFLVRKDAGLSGRSEIWQESIDVFKKSPIIGGGNIPSGIMLKESSTTTNVHSFYLKTLLSEGLIGFVIIMLFLVGIFKKNIAIYKKDKLKRCSIFSYVCCIINIRNNRADRFFFLRHNKYANNLFDVYSAYCRV